MIDRCKAADLAAAMLGKLLPEEEGDAAEIEAGLIQRTGVDLDCLAATAELLLPLCACDVSPLTKLFRRGFVHDGSYIVKQTMVASQAEAPHG